VIKLKSQQHGGHLHSHKVNYGTQGGSGQQSVTGYGPDSDENDYWLIQAFNGKTKSAHVQGRPIVKGDIVILRHLATNTWLHSHAQHASPLSSSQEVSAYAFKDDSNFWEVQVPNEMIRGEPVRFKHVATDKFLAMNPHRFFFFCFERIDFVIVQNNETDMVIRSPTNLRLLLSQRLVQTQCG
jgi:dolichyl-phosphate-mannose--protein O-mannosyl transferase